VEYNVLDGLRRFFRQLITQGEAPCLCLSSNANVWKPACPLWNNYREPSWQRIPLPVKAARSGGPVNIGFRIPTARSPTSEGISADPRQLGIGLIAIRPANDRQP
jgi:hypothetical protein